MSFSESMALSVGMRQSKPSIGVFIISISKFLNFSKVAAMLPQIAGSSFI